MSFRPKKIAPFPSSSLTERGTKSSWKGIETHILRICLFFHTDDGTVRGFKN